MTLKDDGFRFYVAPDGKQGGWKKPIYQATFYPDWTDTTDLSDEEFLNFLLENLDDTSES